MPPPAAPGPVPAARVSQTADYTEHSRESTKQQAPKYKQAPSHKHQNTNKLQGPNNKLQTTNKLRGVFGGSSWWFFGFSVWNLPFFRLVLV
jgi:hypothetical protein